MQTAIDRLTVAGRAVHVSERSGAPLVMLTRLAGASGGVWDGLWQRLAKDYTVASVDLGAPDADARPASVFNDFATAIAAVARTLSERPFHLVGWNGGAHIGLHAAHAAPDRLASLTLMTPFRQVGERRQIEAGLDLLEHLLRTGARERYAYHWFMAGFSDAYLQTSFDAVEALVRKRLENDAFLSLDVDRAMAWMRALRRDHLSDAAVRTIRVPTLILAAGQNRWHAGPTAAMAEALHALLPQSELAVFQDKGAFFPIEAARQTAARLTGFFARHEPAIINNAVDGAPPTP